jgi:hypothetical protein
MDLQRDGISLFSVNNQGAFVGLSNGFISTNGRFGFTLRSAIQSPADGILRLTNAGQTDFERIQFGPAVSGFPALQTASSNAQTGLAATFTNGSANITTATNTYAADDVVQFTNATGALPTGFSTSTNYYVLASGLSSTNIQVSATSGGVAITAGSAGVGSQTVTRQNICVFTNGLSTITTPVVHGLRVGEFIVIRGSGAPSGFVNNGTYYVRNVLSTTSFNLSPTYNGNLIAASSVPTGPTSFARLSGIAIRNADNTFNTNLYTGTIYSSGTIVSSLVNTTELQYGTKLYNSASGATILGPNQLRQVLTNIGQNNFSRLSFGAENSTSPALQTATTTSVSVTFTNATADITTVTGFGVVAGDVVRFTNSGGALPTSVNSSTDYYIVGTPTSTTIQVATSFGGTAIVHNGAGTGTHTATRGNGIYVRNGDNSAYSQLYSGNIVANAPTGYTGRLLDVQIGSSSQFSVNTIGSITTNGGLILGSNSSFQFSGKSRFSSAADGVMLIANDGVTDFNRLQLGGTTPAFPAIKRNGTTIETVLANDSGFAATQSLYDRFGAGTPEGNVTAPVGAVYHRTDGGAGTSFYVKESGTGNTGWVAK